ncbi:MAG TPA: hypothetical protein VHV74_11345 [Pseudonocardiaceae bacterium]|nr:hypothetical protein [Pseudonocardiaceae bacterium]
MPRGPAGTLVAAGVLQAAQALMWMFLGLLIGMGEADVHRGQPVTVVLVIAAVGAFAIGIFVLALAAGTLGRSDVCRVASVVFQAVSGAFVVAACISLLNHGGGSLTIMLDPTTGPTFLVRPGFVVAMLVSTIAVAVLLMCRQSYSATRSS